MPHLADLHARPWRTLPRRTLFLLGAFALASSAAMAATITVAPGAVVVAADGDCSLREAIDNANFDSQVDNDDCPAGEAGVDTIELAAGATYTMAGPLPADSENGLPAVVGPIVIQGHGAIVERDGSLVCALDGNHVVGQEFRILSLLSGGDLKLFDLTLRNGCADGRHRNDGGAIFMKLATLTLDHVTMSDNRAFDKSGALDVARSTVTIVDSTFSGNFAGGGGGAIGNGNGGVMTITRSLITGNSASGQGGGGIGSFGDLTILDSTISDNHTVDTPGGGGIGATGGTLHIENSTVSGNSAEGTMVAGGGGGIGIVFTDTLVQNSTIFGNSTTGIRGGGGIADLFSTLRLVSSTVVGNSSSAAAGAGISLVSQPDPPAPATFEAKSSIVAGNIEDGDCVTYFAGAVFASSGVNMDSDGTCAAVDPTFTQESPAALNLGPLADNGGPTQTIALGSGSVAIDAAADCTDLANNPISTDQRGVARPQDGDGTGGALCDVGAYEAVAPGPAAAVVPMLGADGLALLALLVVAGGLGFLRRV